MQTRVAACVRGSNQDVNIGSSSVAGHPADIASRCQIFARERSQEAETKLEDAKAELARMIKAITEVRTTLDMPCILHASRDFLPL